MRTGTAGLGHGDQSQGSRLSVWRNSPTVRFNSGNSSAGLVASCHILALGGERSRIQSVDAKVKQFLLTPEVGYRVVDNDKFKIDAIVGFRYWHLGESLEFTPSLVGGVSASQNWVDALGGARIHLPLSQKAMITVGGDAGGGGANSDYQVAGLLGYKISKKCVLQAGWRYLDVNYRSSSSFVYNTATSGLLLGLTISLK